MEGNGGRVLDFWVDQVRHQKFWVLSPTDAERSSIAKTVNGIALPTHARKYHVDIARTML
jgi:hypothetical protein